VTSLVLGIIGLFLFVFFMIVPILALVFGLVGGNQIRSSGGRQTGEGMATAGAIMGGLGILFFVFLVAAGGNFNVHFG
jgi:hypothetical protein